MRRFANREEELLYHVWREMRSRCLNAIHKDYQWYGGRGIKVCRRWQNDFLAFVADVGPRPKDMTLDRIDGDKNYEPGNCRWATPSEQSRNRRKEIQKHKTIPPNVARTKGGRYRAYSYVRDKDGKRVQIHHGTYDTIALATAAVIEGRR